jgi:hypothetical protein
MSYVQYSPWQDAASFGQGLGATISKILFTLPQMRQQAAQQERDYQLDVRRVAAQEQMARSHSSLYQAQQENIPVTNELRRSQQSDRELLHAVTEKLMGARADDLEAQRPSKVAERQARTGMIDTQRSLFPEIQQHRFGLQDALTEQAQQRTQQMPEHERNYGLIAQSQAALAGVGGEAPPQAAQPIPQKSLFSAPGPSKLAPFPQPPTPLHKVRALNKATGETGWATPEAIQNDPNLQPIQ